MEELFGQLRSLLQSGYLEDEDAFFGLLRKAYTLDPERYEQEFRAYLADFSFPAFQAESLGEMEEFAELLPSNTPRDLCLPGQFLGDEGLDRLSNMESLRYVSTLDMSRNNISKVGVEALSASNYTQSLRDIDFGDNLLGVVGFQYLFTAHNLWGVERLALLHNDIQDTGLSICTTVQQARPALKTLILEKNGLSSQGAAYLASSPCLGSLETLSLGDNDITGEGLCALAGSEHLTSLREFVFRKNMVDEEAMCVLAASSTLRGLEKLDLSWCEVGTESAYAFAQVSGVRPLKELFLYANRLGFDGVFALLNAPSLSSLTHLSVGDNQIGSQGVELLMNSPNLSRLEELDLSENMLGDEGAIAVASSRFLGSVRKLCLDSNQITEEGAMALATARSLDGVREVDLRWNHVGERAEHMLRSSKHLPRGAVIWLLGKRIVVGEGV